MPNPPTMLVFPRALDPSGRLDFAVKITSGDRAVDLLDDEEAITGFTIALPADSIAAGLQLLDAEHAPAYGGLVFYFWVQVVEGSRGNSIFDGSGAELGVEITYTTDKGRTDQFTVGVRVANL